MPQIITQADTYAIPNKFFFIMWAQKQCSPDFNYEYSIEKSEVSQKSNSKWLIKEVSLATIDLKIEFDGY